MDSKDLTKIERSLFIKMLTGADMLAIEEQFSIKRNIIKEIVNNIFKKFNVQSKPELLAKYMSSFIIQKKEKNNG